MNQKNKLIKNAKVINNQIFDGAKFFIEKIWNDNLCNQLLVGIEHPIQYNKQGIDPVDPYIDPNHDNVPKNHDVMNDI